MVIIGRVVSEICSQTHRQTCSSQYNNIYNRRVQLENLESKNQQKSNFKIDSTKRYSAFLSTHILY